jgi:hypothetical protein
MARVHQPARILIGLLAVAILGTACATSSDRRAGIRWEVVWDAPAGLGRRYSIILTETAGRRVELDYVESRTEGSRFDADGPVTVRTSWPRRYLGETLPPGGEQRIAFTFPGDGLVFASKVRHEFHGRIDGIRPLQVNVRVRAPRP